MTKRMLIDAAHAEETRVVVVDGQRIEELDFESQSRKQLRGNIYLAKITRVEPSLQAAFVEYGGNRHGFLAFNEIHPDYYQIPVADREALMREAEQEEDEAADARADDDSADDEDEVEEALERRRRRLMRRYKIQEVIRRRQIMLVQVVKEERGNKGAALTTYLSLAGRYCVLMPNTARGGGISRKITTATDRKRLKAAAQSLELPQGMGLIIRTAGASRTKLEIKRDYEYLMRMWENIRDTTLQSVAPALIYAEEDLVKRAIRDMYDKDIDSIEVEGEAGYREARDFMRMIMPSQAKKIQPYRDATPLFVKHKIEDQLALIHSPVAPLRSGGYIVINQTEALVAVDVNSGRATRERNIEATALKTNMEAAEEAARQLRLRDLAGLIVIDFIDMDESKNNRAVEKKLKDCLADDRARIQMGKISPFGLMEISRQRRRSGVLEGTTHVCEHCQGMGRVRSVESSALAALRAIETEAAKGGGGEILVRLPTAVGLYVLNEKRVYLSRLEQTHDLEVTVATDDALHHSDVEVERTASRDANGERDGESDAPPPSRRRAPAPVVEDDADIIDVTDFADEDEEEQAEASAGEENPDEDGRPRRRRRRRGRRGDEAPGFTAREPDAGSDDEAESGQDQESDVGGSEDAGGSEGELDADGKRRRRRRGRRGGRRLREETPRVEDPYAWVHAHDGADAPRASEDPYGWRDPHAPGAPQGREIAVEAEAGREAVSAPQPPQTAPVSGDDPYAWGEEPETPPDEALAKAPKRERARRSRGGRSRRGGSDRNADTDTLVAEGDQSAAAPSQADPDPMLEFVQPPMSSRSMLRRARRRSLRASRSRPTMPLRS